VSSLLRAIAVHFYYHLLLFMLNDCALMKIFKLTSFHNIAFIGMFVGLSDVGIVIKNRFLNFISKLQAQHNILPIC